MNRLWLAGVVKEASPLRHSPAGIPIAEALIEHSGLAELAGGARELTFELTVQAAGALAAKLSALPPGTRVKLDGALNRKSRNSRQLILIVNRIEKE